MKIERAAPVNELLAKLIFLVLPTGVLSYFLLGYVNEYYAILTNQSMQQAMLLGVGMAGALLLYSFRFRFLPTFIGLLAFAYSIYLGLDKYESGEFDAFFIARQFEVASTLFVTGWLMGWGFARLRYWSVFVAALALVGSVTVIARSRTDTVQGLMLTFAPAVLYAVYIVFTSEQIYNYKDKTGKFWWFLTRRLTLFLLLAGAFLANVLYLAKDQIKDTVDNYGGKGKQGQNSMLKKNKDNTFDLKDYSRLSGALGRSNELLFCAHIDNFFPNTDIPNPLYLTAFYFTKFDTATETFERDSTIPYNDLFEPDPSKIPLFKTKADSSVIKNSLGAKLRHTVEVEIYSRSLSPATYLAPNVGYFIQPITIEKDFRDQFKSAFRAKSYVSALNSAYFVYNVQNPEIKKFQEMRFEVLREIKNYDSVDEKFMTYYTYMPDNPKFGTITQLAHRITDSAKTPVDKVLAIRDYFLSRDENGQRLYQYTDNPGIPDLPNASKLMYFLNENHKGYCAYFAGATLFMLRSLGIPSRIAVGFLTEERSDKNKGWYWYYANQAHAWVQVYFPGYGWLDFDTTVGNDNENRSTPQPDGTPPMQPPKAWLAAEGMVTDVDTLRKLLHLKVRQYVFHDVDYKAAADIDMTLDMHVAVVYRDSIGVPLASVHKGDEGTFVSYSEVLKKLEPRTGEDAEKLAARMPVPIPVDELYLKRKDTEQAKQKPPVVTTPEEPSIKKALWTGLIALVVLMLVLFSLPRLVWLYLLLRRKGANGKAQYAYWTYVATNYWLHMSGMIRGGAQTPMQFARTVVDPALGTDYAAFMNVYLKQKYSGAHLNDAEVAVTRAFLPVLLAKGRKYFSTGQRLAGFLNPVRMVSFFVTPETDKDNV